MDCIDFASVMRCFKASLVTFNRGLVGGDYSLDKSRISCAHTVASSVMNGRKVVGFRDSLPDGLGQGLNNFSGSKQIDHSFHCGYKSNPNALHLDYSSNPDLRSMFSIIKGPIFWYTSCIVS